MLRTLPGLLPCLLPAFLVATLAGQNARGADGSGLVTLGLGKYATQPKGGLLSSAEPLPPQARYVGGALQGKAVPTNQWYSSVIFTFPSQPLHAHPMTYRTGPEGFEVGLASKEVVPTRRGNNDIRYPHQAAISIAPAGAAISGAQLTRVADWLAEIRLASAQGAWLQATVLHGSPFSYYESGTAQVRFHLSEPPRLLADASVPAADGRVMALQLAGKAYGIFGPTGSRWSWSTPTDLVLELPAGARYFSVAGLPQADADTLHRFAALAYAFPTDTRVEWNFDPATSLVRARYSVTTLAREGDNHDTLLGLYPHQWDGQAVAGTLWEPGYDTVRGRIRLLSGNSFTVERPYHGIVPYWPGIRDPQGSEAVNSLLSGDQAKSRQIFSQTGMGRGTYWVGKGLGALAQLLSVAEAEGKTDVRDALLAQLKSRLEDWFDGEHGSYFMQDARIGTFVGYPQEYNSVHDMNDHHFHYGYWIMAAAHVALRDPDWISQAKWGGIVGRIVADIATPERGRADFPFLRNFDVYEGHSWASGDAAFSEGNNQESSSEAVNAWAALILLGEATGDRPLRDLGLFLYTSEVASVQNYWFDLHHQVLAPEFGKPFASMVFGGKYAYNTWWTEEPRQILGINVLPITAASTYLGADPAYVRRCVDALNAETAAYLARGMSDGTPIDIWQDVIASYLALADADAGTALWQRRGTVERGETRTHTLHWLWSLREMGVPDFDVRADTPLYAVFRRKDGARTYLAYNAGRTALQVHFSDGHTLTAGPGQLARAP